MNKILLLQMNRLGDLVQTLPVMRGFKEENPWCQLTVVCLAEFQDILADCPYLDRLVPIRLADVEALQKPELQQAFPERPPFDQPEFREGYDLIVNLTSNLGAAILLEKMRAVRKLGRIHTFAGELRLLGDWTKYLFAMVGNRTDNLFNLVDVHMGMAGMPPKPYPASLVVTPPRLEEARALLARERRPSPSVGSEPRPARPLVALQAGASDLNRAWALENFAQLAQSLLGEGCDVVLLGDAKEKPLASRLKALVSPVSGAPHPGVEASLIDLVGRTNLPLLPAVLKCCDLLVSNDTGTIHVAAGAGTRTLGLFFSTAYYSETAPYGDGHCVLQVEIPCAPCNASSRCPVQICRQHLPVAAVLETVKWQLDADPRAQPPAPRPHLSLYRSRFLTNGSLLYVPARPEAVTSHYLACMLGRVLWERALAVPRDEFLESNWRRLRAYGDWEPRRRAADAVLTALEPSFRIGRETSAELRALFVGPSPDLGKITELNGRLSALGAAFTAATADGGLLGRFLLYEFMDMDYSPYPALAAELEEKYGRLQARGARLREAVDLLSS